MCASALFKEMMVKLSLISWWMTIKNCPPPLLIQHTHKESSWLPFSSVFIDERTRLLSIRFFTDDKWWITQPATSFFFLLRRPAGRPYAHTKAQTTAAHHDQLDDPSSKVSSYCYMAPTKKKYFESVGGDNSLYPQQHRTSLIFTV